MPAKWKTEIFLTNIVEKNKTKNAKRKSFINEGGNMRKLKVLVAESQTVVKQQLTKELEKDLEIAVVGATDNGKDAFEIFKREEPNIVIFDLLLPIYDGYTLLDKINEYGVSDKTKLIMTTTVTSDLLICEAFHRNNNMHNNKYLYKRRNAWKRVPPFYVYVWIKTHPLDKIDYRR